MLFYFPEFAGALIVGNFGNDKNIEANDKYIKAQAALSISASNPLESYVYAKISKFSIGSVAKAFGYDLKLPRFLLDTGFPEGVLVSFSKSGLNGILFNYF